MNQKYDPVNILRLDITCKCVILFVVLLNLILKVLRVSRLLIIYGFIVYSYKKVVKPSTLFNRHGLQFLEAEF